MKKHTILLLLAFLTFSANSQFNFQNPVRWNFTSVDKGNGIHELHFKGNIEKPWYVYAIKLDKEGPIPTSVGFEDPDGYTPEGSLLEITKAVKKYDPGFDFEIGMYSKNVELMHVVRLNTSREVLVKGYIEYQSCNDETCLPPFQQEFSFKISGKQVAASEMKDTSLKAITSSIELDTTPSVLNNMQVVSVDETNSNDGGAFQSEQTEGSLGLFLFFAFLAGLAAILTPCVFPMIPMTVSFFMRDSTNKGLAIIKGLVFGFSMILVYTGLGVVVGLTGLGGEAGTVISTHWIPNLLFFILFVLFAASFFGMFELIIPAGLVNKADKQADRGGIAGAFFMGITTVLVSFSCTGPIVGALLIESAGGLALKPILGMFFFSLAFALPFTLLAIFPSMLKNLPKSGGWLNSIKVVLGFIILAFALKFLLIIDQTYHLDFISREVYLSIWFVLSILLGIYFLGRLKFAHDSNVPYITVPRFALAIISFTFAVYLFTGILGADLRSISSHIPPKSASAFSFNTSSSTAGENDQVSTYCGPGKYNDLLSLPHGLKGYFNYEDGLKCATEKNKPIFLDFTGHSCSNCKQMENLVWSDPEVLKILKEDYVVISLYTDDKTKVSTENIVFRLDGKELRTMGEINKNIEIERFNTIATPLYVLLNHDGKLLAQPIGKELNVQNFINFLQAGKARF